MSASNDNRLLRAHGDMFSCANKECPSALQCWRFLKPDHEPWQTYMSPKLAPGQNRCNDFIGVAEEAEMA